MRRVTILWLGRSFLHKNVSAIKMYFDFTKKIMKTTSKIQLNLIH